MKGFDRAQGIPPSGEAAVHEEVKDLLRNSAIPYWADKVPLDVRNVADFGWGYSDRFFTHICELESARHWEVGLSQADRYAGLYLQHSGLLTLPTLILFGDVSEERFETIRSVCLYRRALLVAHKLAVDGSPWEPSLNDLLN